MLSNVAGRIDTLLPDPLRDEDFICHAHYRDFMRDPARGVRGIYEHFDIPYARSFDERSRVWASRNPLTRHGKWEYSLDRFVVSAAELEKQFADYRERFGIPREGT